MSYIAVDHARENYSGALQVYLQNRTERKQE